MAGGRRELADDGGKAGGDAGKRQHSLEKWRFSSTMDDIYQKNCLSEWKKQPKMFYSLFSDAVMCTFHCFSGSRRWKEWADDGATTHRGPPGTITQSSCAYQRKMKWNGGRFPQIPLQGCGLGPQCSQIPETEICTKGSLSVNMDFGFSSHSTTTFT